MTIGECLLHCDADPNPCCAAGEFELVPGVPVVIALDDFAPEEAELGEPWEHISADELDEKRGEPRLSYATVLANAL